jgi:hypothetical protein
MWSTKKLPWQFERRLELLRIFPDHKEEVEMCKKVNLGKPCGGSWWGRGADIVPAAG